MTSNYEAIRKVNQEDYGKAIGRFAPGLLVDRYDDRSHFIYELLQNAEDALRRRAGRDGTNAVVFELSAGELRVSHHGAPFNEVDVRAICGIAQSSKDIDSIGRFGIGFKSVFAYSDRPEIRSGDEHFAIENFVWPVALDPVTAHTEETTFSLPLSAEKTYAHDEIAAGLMRLGPRSLLFLKHINEITWTVEGAGSGRYLRDEPNEVAPGCCKVVVIGQESGREDLVEEAWLVFAKPVGGQGGHGFVEIAFLLERDDAGVEHIRRVDDSALVVHFPTVVPTNLGFLVQGPYLTTPSRDNVKWQDEWNKGLVTQTASLLTEALPTLRDLDYLSVAALRCLPLDPAKFPAGAPFTPLLDALRVALKSTPLLPLYGGGYASAGHVLLSRTQDLRDLLSPRQLSSVAGGAESSWLSEEITGDRTPDLRSFLMRELGVQEVTPDAVMPWLTKVFLEAQSDDWIVRLYEFLTGQALAQRAVKLRSIPILRLESGEHVPLVSTGQVSAFLPGPSPTGFPTIRKAACATTASRAFLTSMGVTEPDPVDDVVWNVLPTYRKGAGVPEVSGYAADMARIRKAFTTDSKLQKDKLVDALRSCPFVVGVDAGTTVRGMFKPGELYIATQRMKEIFGGVTGIKLVDDEFECLRGEDMREVLEASGSTRYLQPVRSPSRFNDDQLAEMRKAAGAANSTGQTTVEDYDLRGLVALLGELPNLDSAAASRKAKELWEALRDVESRRGANSFLGTYRWFYFHPRVCSFDAAFVDRLNQVAWIPNGRGAIVRPAEVGFDAIGWTDAPYLLSKIRFKPPILDMLAREAGIEPGILDLLKRLGVSSEDDLKARLGITDAQDPAPPVPPTAPPAPAPAPPVSPWTNAPTPSGGSGGGGGTGGGTGGGAPTPSTGGGTARGPFISYIAAHPGDDGGDPDGLASEARLALEAKAIAHILSSEPALLTTAKNNPGFDLYEEDSLGRTIRWVEVKAMTGTLDNRPVAMSSMQFDQARRNGEHFWLYVVELAGSDRPRVVRIQDPVGKTMRFSFDRGWVAAAAEQPRVEDARLDDVRDEVDTGGKDQ